MKKRRLKKSVSRVLLFLIISSFILFVFLVFDKDDITQPTDGKTPQGNIPLEPVEPGETQQPKPENTSYLNKITNKDSLNDEQLKLITDFFDEYYKSLKELKEYDLTKFFVDVDSEDALIIQTALSVLIENRKLKPNDLRLNSVKYDLNINGVNTNNGEVKISILENTYMRFAFMSDIESKIYNIENEFTIKKIDDEYKILKYEKVQDLYVMITDVYNGGGKQELDKIKQNYISIISKKVESNKKDYQDFLNGNIETKECDHKYDRQKALNYALSWVNKRNSNWTTFDSNCQNYASQVLYNGGIVMDYNGSADSHLQWKFYSSSYNTNQEAKGYVYTWTYVPYFYTYAKNNTGTGLCASVDANIYSAEAGDVIHVGPSGPTRHAVVVIGDYKVDGKTVDILVNSNTVDLENFPISAYAYPYISLIKVYGWND